MNTMKALLTMAGENELTQIHETTLKVLEEVGIIVQSQEVVEHLSKCGAKTDGKKVYLPKKMVEDAIKLINKEIVFGARNPNHDFTIPYKNQTFNTTNGYSPFIYDEPGKPRRNSTGKDLAKIAQLCDGLEYLDFFWPIVMPTEETVSEMEEISAFNIAIRNNSKHIECSCSSPGAAYWQVKIATAVAGSEAEFKKRPLFSVIASPTTPLTFEKCTTEAMVILAKAGVPISPMDLPMSGTTAPATLPGTLVMTNAEQLATLVIIKSYNPEAPMIYATDSTTADLRTGGLFYNNSDYDLLSIMTADLAHYYGIPSIVSHAANETHAFENKEGFLANILRVAMSQMTRTDNSVWLGSLDDCMATSLWDIVLDHETLKYVKTYLKNIEVNENTLAYEAIKEIGPGGEFISAEHTMMNFRNELNYTLPEDSFIFKNGGGDFVELAKKEAERILEEHTVPAIEQSILNELDEIMIAARAEYYNK
ncbi:MAG: trimethylamine methyltransferase family protein [Clostridiales bacterium]